MNNSYLYHYTNIETLALILKNKTIRLNSLNKMDDLLEGQASDLNNIGRFVYISSWTEDEEESIPMWKMYSSLNRGIRIKLKKDPFVRYSIADEAQKNGFIINGEDNEKFSFLFPVKDMIGVPFTTSAAMANTDNFLYQVEYTDDEALLKPKVIESDDKSTNIRFNRIGRYKSKKWEFQKEWRYLFWAVPMNSFDVKNAVDNIWRIINAIKNDDLKPPFDHYDLSISDEAFAEMEIMMGPTVSYGMEIMVNSLVKDYNPTAKVIYSNLKGKIRD